MFKNLITQSSGLKLEVNDYIDLPIGTIPLNYGYTDDFSISVILQTKSLGLLQNCIHINYGQFGFFFYFLIGVRFAGDITLIWNNTFYQALFSRISYDTLLNSDKTHIVVTRPANGVVGKMYINGQEILTDFLDLGATATSTSSLSNQIGANNSSTSFLNADMYKLTHFNKILDLAEVTELFTTQGEIIPITAQSNVVANYKFKEKEGFVNNDSSINSLHGNIINKSISDVTIGATNSWLYANGQPFDYSKFSLLKI